MLTTASELGAKRANIENGLVKTEISKAEAYRRHGRRIVDDWIKAGHLHPVSRNGSWRISVMELEIVSRTTDLIKSRGSKTKVTKGRARKSDKVSVK